MTTLQVTTPENQSHSVQLRNKEILQVLISQDFTVSIAFLIGNILIFIVPIVLYPIVSLLRAVRTRHISKIDIKNIKTKYDLKWNIILHRSHFESFQVLNFGPISFIGLPTSFINNPYSAENEARFLHEIGHLHRMDLLAFGCVASSPYLNFCLLLIILIDSIGIKTLGDVTALSIVISLTASAGMAFYATHLLYRREYMADTNAMIANAIVFEKYLEGRIDEYKHVRWKNPYYWFMARSFHPTWPKRLQVQKIGLKHESIKLFINSAIIPVAIFVYPPITAFTFAMASEEVRDLLEASLGVGYVVYFYFCGETVKKLLQSKHLGWKASSSSLSGIMVGTIASCLSLETTTKYLKQRNSALEFVTRIDFSQALCMTVSWLVVLILTYIITCRMNIKPRILGPQSLIISYLSLSLWTENFESSPFETAASMVTIMLFILSASICVTALLSLLGKLAEK